MIGIKENLVYLISFFHAASDRRKEKYEPSFIQLYTAVLDNNGNVGMSDLTPSEIY